MKVIPLKQGNYTVNKNKKFALIATDSSAEGTKVAIQPFLIITENDYVLMDTGFNSNQEEMPPVVACLANENIKPEQITKVLISHFHKDHIDGLGTFSSGKLTVSFPNALIYLQRRELDFALTQVENPSYRINILQQLAELPNVVLLDDDQGNITDKISYQVSGGHTPFHQVFWVKEKEETIFYGADNLPQQNYLKYPLAFKNDFDGRKALEERTKWEEEGKLQKWTVLLYHDLKNPILKF